MVILLKNIAIYDIKKKIFEKKDILIELNIISKISNKINDEEIQKLFSKHNNINNDSNNNRIIDCKGKAIIPGFINMHTHSAMTIFRGYGSDMNLHEWLTKKIWPIESKLSEEDCYWSTRFACIEMIKNGITTFSDMYWHFNGLIKAINDSKIRCYCSNVIIDMLNENKLNNIIKETNINYQNYKKNEKEYNNLINFTLGPHAIYTVSKKTLLWCKEFATKNDLIIHMHISETENEILDCIKKYGLRPIEYLEKIGFLQDNIIFAHGVWLNENEIKILKKYKITIVHNPISNMKLTVGGKFPIELYNKNNISITLGTDGVSSNNSLNMFECMKFASLLNKHNFNNPTIANANESYNMAIKNAYDYLGLNGGEIKIGKIADLLIIDLNHYSLIPNNDLISNLVYSANPECINTVICNGKILMENRIIKDEELIRNKVKEITKKLLN
jgi:5-methylthioadenosine/S-adenosylhomocysteine deaminase